MPVGDDASAAGYPLVPGTTEEGKVKWGAREINRTRDFVAQVKTLIPRNRAEYRAAAGSNWGFTVPSNADGQDGDTYDRVL